MEVIFAIPFLLIPLVLPLVTGLMAKSFGRKFWRWFFIGIPLPFISNIILLCLPDKSKEKTNGLKLVQNENGSDHFFINQDSKLNIDHKNNFSASA